jgi:hypothetical protein
MHKFTNAQKMHEKHPDTFEVPSKEELNVITLGESVKISHENERFWVTVTGIDKNTITGTVDNDLFCKHPFQLGDTISFKKHHIYCLYNKF